MKFRIKWIIVCGKKKISSSCDRDSALRMLTLRQAEGLCRTCTWRIQLRAAKREHPTISGSSWYGDDDYLPRTGEYQDLVYLQIIGILTGNPFFIFALAGSNLARTLGSAEWRRSLFSRAARDIPYNSSSRMSTWGTWSLLWYASSMGAVLRQSILRYSPVQLI